MIKAVTVAISNVLILRPSCTCFGLSFVRYRRISPTTRGSGRNRIQKYEQFSSTTSSSSFFFSSLFSTSASTTTTITTSDGEEKKFTSHPCGFSDELIDQYDAFILDQFGVLHNGLNALEGAVDLVNYLAVEKKKKLIILSNTSAPSTKAIEKLPKYGFDTSLILGAVTSGEEAAKYIIQNYVMASSTTTNISKVIMFTWDASDISNPRLTAMPYAFLEKCGPQIQLAKTVQEADMLLLHGSEVWLRGDVKDDMEEHVELGSFIETGSMDTVVEPILQQCLQKNLPCICANPDLIVQTPLGGVAYMPGTIAQKYQEMGGTVLWFGKPQPEHFVACLQILELPAHRVAHVGDSLHHDIAGAIAANIPNIFVTSGIHLNEFQHGQYGILPPTHELQDLFKKQNHGKGIVPNHVVPAFRLGND